MDFIVSVFIILMLLGLGVLSLIFAFQCGWFDQFQTLQKLIKSINMAIKIIDNIAAVTKPSTTSHCSINNSGLSMSVTYTRVGRDKLLNIPYRSDMKEKMRMWTVYLISDTNKPRNITQEPGIPYICTPEQLGGKEILATSSDTGDIIQFKKGNTPGYLGIDMDKDKRITIQNLN